MDLYRLILLNDIHIDPTNDYYDAGHLDISGAAKVSSHFATYLKDKEVPKNNTIDIEKWQTDYNFYLENFPYEIVSAP